MNLCCFLGRMVADAELRYTQDGKGLARFRLAVNRKFKRENEPDADFLNFVAFGKNAENISKYFPKGSMILVESHVQTGSYKNKEGQKVYTTDFIVDSWDFCGSKGETKTESKDGEFAPVPTDDNLPWD